MDALRCRASGVRAAAARGLPTAGFNGAGPVPGVGPVATELSVWAVLPIR